MPTPRCRARGIALAAAAVIITLTSSCGGSDDGNDEAAPDGARPTTTAPASTTTTSQTVGPAEWVEVTRDIYERSFTLRTDPDLDRIADVYAEGCTCWEMHHSTVQFLLDNGQHVEGEPTEVLFVRFEQTDPESGITNLTIRARTRPMRRVANDTGEVIEEYEPTTPGCAALAVVPDGPDGSYRVYSETDLPECPAEATS